MEVRGGRGEVLSQLREEVCAELAQEAGPTGMLESLRMNRVVVFCRTGLPWLLPCVRPLQPGDRPVNERDEDRDALQRVAQEKLVEALFQVRWPLLQVA